MLITDMEEALVTEMRFTFDRHYRRLVRVEYGHRRIPHGYRAFYSLVRDVKKTAEN